MLGDPGALVGGIAAVPLDHLGKGFLDLHLPDVIKKIRRRIKIVRRSGTGGLRESALTARKRKAKIRSQIESTSPTARRETSR